MKKTHIKKMIAPVVVTVLIVAYFIVYGSVLFTQSGIPTAVRILGIAIPLILSGVMICVMIERIKEIKKGEEDDLSEY